MASNTVDSWPVVKRTTSAEVAERLRREILLGGLAPGARLRQNDIALRFSVSTTPVREAFALLQAEGLLRIDPHRGAFVFRPTPDEILESYEIREALETLAIRKAIPRLSEERLDELQDLVDAMRKTRKNDRWMEMNNHFHLGLYEAAAMPRLITIMANLRDSANAYIRLYLDREPRNDDDHQAILDACRARDVERAQQELGGHLRRVVAKLAEYVGSTEQTQSA